MSQPTKSFRDVEVIWKGRRVYVQAREAVDPEGRPVLQVASLHYADERDKRGAQPQKTFAEAEPTGEAGKSVAFSALSEEDRASLFAAVKAAWRR